METFYIIGRPGVGKSTLVKEILAAGGFGGSDQHELQAGKGFAYYDLQLGPRRLRILGDYGEARGAFGGTDAFSMSAIGPVIDQLKAWAAELEPVVVLAEGDRLANDRFFNAARELGTLHIVHLWAPEDQLAAQLARRSEATGKQQNPEWAAGRSTKVRNLVKNWRRHPNFLDLQSSPGVALKLLGYIRGDWSPTEAKEAPQVTPATPEARPVAMPLPEVRDITLLLPVEYNPRTAEASGLGDSIEGFGFLQPLIVNMYPGREGRIVGGEKRWTELRARGITEAPVVAVYLPPDRERELNIRLNRNQANWDWAKLEEFFAADELIDWGFEHWEFGDIPPEMDEETNNISPLDHHNTSKFMAAALKKFELIIPAAMYDRVSAGLRRVAAERGLKNNSEVMLSLLEPQLPFQYQPGASIPPGHGEFQKRVQQCPDPSPRNCWWISGLPGIRLGFRARR